MSDVAHFSTGLLNPHAPVPALVKGRVERRYAVYRNNVTIGLIRALESNFPAVRRLLGEEYFFGFARDYVQAHPPKTPLMFTYGADFPRALEQSIDLENFPYLADIARVEILWRQSYHAADAAPLEPDAIARIEPEALFNSSFTKHPATRLFTSSYAVGSIFAANRSTDPSFASSADIPESILVTRPHFDVSVFTISQPQYKFFSALLNDYSLSDAIEIAVADDADLDLTRTLALLLQSGAFHSIQRKNEKVT